MKLIQQHDDLFYYDYLARSMGLNFDARCILIRCGEKFSVISPGPLDENLEKEIKALGEVGWLIAPNSFHHLFYQDWQKTFPQAESWGVSAVARKRKDLLFDHIFYGESPSPESIQVFPLLGSPAIEERAFYHPASKSLILIDLLFNVHEALGVLTRFNYRLLGVWKKTATSRLYKMLTRDKPALRGSLAPLLELPLQRVIVNHGEIIEEQPSEILKGALQWVLKT